ncbi:MAG TPA: biotin carboxylase N-terminal domain-containing protein [Pseudonocardiaceae bacterium]|jgi:acetyl-CoA carboxylase biotin carboxylase subunit|nr:biotin carboxylase N-terminal domain-containing protein [Pseudonocardiaceae bacterium]
MLRRVLVANRGEIAVRIVRACFDERIESVVAAARGDNHTLAVDLADHHLILEGHDAAHTYLSVPQIVAAALLSRCDAIHPGYGFLSERPELAQACEIHGLSFIGPSPQAIRCGGDKLQARALAASLGIPVGAGSGEVAEPADALAAAPAMGYPVLLKAAAGGGGRGMAVVRCAEKLESAFARARQEASAAFGDGRLYLEHYVQNARHIEVQVLADSHGALVHLGDRDCSLQRRHQKLLEEAPATCVPHRVRAELAQAALSLCKALNYVGAATVEFLLDQDTDTYSFLEINTRVQVEHPVTEQVTGIDIVREQLRIAGGARLGFRQRDVKTSGHAIECRINAESAREGFLPTPGQILRWVPPTAHGVRVDTHCFPGYIVPATYDSLLAKLIVHDLDRAAAVQLLNRALARFDIAGIETTLDFHRAVARHRDFSSNRINTDWVESSFIPYWRAGSGG